jgi:RNA polymerase sigma-70 factor (ECF subfamily)
MSKIHRTCYWHYFYGDEYEACADCRQKLLDAEELYCLGAYTKDAKYPKPTFSCCRGCYCHCWHYPCPFACTCLLDLWNELFRRARCNDGTVQRLLPNMSPVEFGTLYHAGYCIAYRITGNDADAHDAVQTALFKMHRRPESPQHLRALFFCAVRNAALDIVRNRKRHVPIDDERLPASEDEGTESLDADMLPFLPEAMSKLPRSDQAILRMHYIEGLSHQEIADRLKVPKTTVNMRLAKGRKRLLAEMLKIRDREGLAVC